MIMLNYSKLDPRKGGGGVKLTPISLDFCTSNLCHLTNGQKIWRICSLIVDLTHEVITVENEYEFDYEYNFLETF